MHGCLTKASFRWEALCFWVEGVPGSSLPPWQQQVPHPAFLQLTTTYNIYLSIWPSYHPRIWLILGPSSLSISMILCSGITRYKPGVCLCVCPSHLILSHLTEDLPLPCKTWLERGFLQRIKQKHRNLHVSAKGGNCEGSIAMRWLDKRRV